MLGRAASSLLHCRSYVSVTAPSRIRGAAGRGDLVATVCTSDREDEIPKVDFKGFGKRKDQGAPLIQALSTISKAQGKDVDTSGRKLVLSDPIEEDSGKDVWCDAPSRNVRELDSKVNDYPFERPFKAIGSGGEEFATSMVTAVESVIGRQVAAEKVTKRYSSGAKYITVVVSVMVTNGDEVVRIYDAMRTDTRMKFFF